jgi:pyrroline-5-carboxylate reductase
MRIGLVGAGNMARAMAHGWGEPVLATDSGSGRAAELVAELGGEALESNAELARRAELVLLAHKPHQLEAVAAEVAPERPRAVASVLGGVTNADLAAAYPGSAVFRLMPNTPVAVRRGIIGYAPVPDTDPEIQAAVVAQMEILGEVVTLDEKQLDVLTSVAGVGPAYVALVAEAWADAAIRQGLPARRATELVTKTLTGAAALIEARGHDTLGVRREVSSPGGTTARGLAALEKAGLRTAFQAALEATTHR